MINKVFDGEKELKAKEGEFLIGLLEGSIYEADRYREMVAAVCETEYLEWPLKILTRMRNFANQ